MGTGIGSRDWRLVLGIRRFTILPLVAFIAAAQPAADWTQQFVGSVPPARSGHALAYDSGHSEVLLFGGGIRSLDFDDTWVWNGKNWIEKFPGIQPPVRSNHAMAYDAGHREVVLFGGQGDVTTAFVVRHDTWVWNGSNWIQRFPGNSPPGRSNFAMVYDARHGEVVLFGGTSPNTFYNDTWVWNGADWIQKFPPVSPPARYGHAMVYDAALGEVVLFGGFLNGTSDANDTWVWNGVTWTQKFGGILPPPRDGHAMAYDASHSQVVLFGGSSNEGFNTLDDTWVWNGSSWTEKFPAMRPAPRSGHAMSYDAAQGRTVLFGGFARTSGAFLDDTWRWTGAGPAR